MSDTNGPIEVKQTKVERVKSFVRKNKTPLAVGVTAGIAFVVGRKTGLSEVANVQFAKDMLQREYEDIAEENFVLLEFLDAKNLRDKYFVFARELEEKAAAA